MVSFANRVRVNTTTVGTGTVTLGTATSNAYATPTEAGLTNGATVTYLIEDTFTSGVPADFEIGTGVYTAAGTTLTRASVLLSKISGTAGTTKLTLSGSAVVTVTASAEDLASFLTTTAAAAAYQPLDATLTALGAYNTNGLLTQTAADTFAGRTVTGTANQITVTNGNGVAGNPTLSLPDPVTFPGDVRFADAKGIYDDSGNKQLIFQKNASAVNYLEIENTVTGTFPIIRPAGIDADIGITFQAKGNITGGLAAFEFALGSGEGAEVLIQNTATGGSGPILNIQNYSASPAVADEVGAIYFGSKDSAGPGHQVYGTISANILDATSGSEDGEIIFKTVAAASVGTKLKIGNGIIIGTGTTYPGAGSLSFGTGTGIFDGAGNEELLFTQTASAVNEITLSNAATGGQPTFSATGGDTNIGIKFDTKGVGALYFVSGAEFGAGTVAVDFDLGTAATPQFKIYNTEASGAGPNILIQNISSSPAAADELGAIIFGGRDSVASSQSYGVVASNILDATSGSEDGEVVVKTVAAGSFAERLKVASGAIIGSSSVYPGSGNLRVTNIELGHDTDTTLTRSAAGTLAVEGVNVETTATTANSKISSIGITIDGGGSAITTGVKGYIEVPYACTINRVTMLADQSGSAVVDIWKDTYANYPPTVLDTITAAAKPTITTATKSQDSTLTGWTTSIAAGDILGFNVDSASTITRLHVILKVTKT